MSFAENLKILRKEKYLSQEQLAEIMEVSRQAVSKWEQGTGYPETEKLILLAERLGVSLDKLLLDKTNETDGETTAEAPGEKELIVPGENAIYIKNEDVFLRCYKFSIMPVVLPTKREPKFILDGVDSASFLGDNHNTLGYYVNKEDAQKELAAIGEALKNGERIYQLQYNCKVTNSLFSPKIVE